MKLIVLGLIAATLTGGFAMAATPEPTYTRVREAAPFEVRSYTPQLAADITLKGPEASTNNAFRILASYIFKEYPSGPIGMTAPVTVQNSQSIGMTAPVTVQQQANDVFMRFYLPERYSLETLPKPEDPRIQIVSLPARTVAVVQFSGWLTEGQIAKHEAMLRDWMAEQNLQAAGPAEVQGYNAPWVLPWWRRNEIWLPL